MHPLLKEFFTTRENYENNIRIHCPTKETRQGLLELAKANFETFNTNELVHFGVGDIDYVYFFWRYLPAWTREPHNCPGFDAFGVPNQNTYEFEEFMAIISCDVTDDVDSMEEIL